MPDIQIFLINLAAHTERLEFQRLQFSELQLSFERIEGTSGSELSASLKERYRFSKYRPLTDTEIGCLLSHLSCWNKVAERDRHVLIIEDDVILSDDLLAFLDDVKDETIPEFVNLETVGVKKILSRRALKRSRSWGALRPLVTDSGGAGAYIVSPQFARELCNEVEIHAGLADGFVHALVRNRGAQLDPALACQMVCMQRFRQDADNPFPTSIERPKFDYSYEIEQFRRYPKLAIRRGLHEIPKGLNWIWSAIFANPRVIQPSVSIFWRYEKYMQSSNPKEESRNG